MRAPAAFLSFLLSVPLALAQPAAPAPVAPGPSKGNRAGSVLPVTLHFKDVEVRDVFRVVARLGGFNVLMGQDVKGKVTIDLDGIDPVKALDLVAAVNGYQVLLKDGVYVVARPATIDFVRGPGNVQIVPISFGDAGELADKLNKLYKGKLEFMADPRSNSLLILRPGGE